MARSGAEISENRLFGSITSSAPFKNLLQKSKVKAMPSRRSRFRSDSENVSPIDPNIQIRDPPMSPSISFSKKSTSKLKIRPCNFESLESSVQEFSAETPDPHVKVVVRIRPMNGLGIGDTLVRKVSKDSLIVAERKYTFDSVLDSNSSQEDVYQLIGAPLVNDALSGYNTTIVAYGETGSGKTFTMWGPPSSMVNSPSSSHDLKGIVPRIFQNLFSEIQKNQGNTDGGLINYQCRCSFLEVYDDKIGDLLDTTQRNLEIKDDPKNGFYVENLSEEYVTSYEDVTQILVKGLSNRKIGSTSISSKSSRSHIMFTCIIESWSKESSSKGFGSSKMSRISLVDLAGFERNVRDDGSRQHVKERKYIKKTSSQLGNLVNILAEESQLKKIDEVHYKSSPLNHLLKESFGGNAKLSIICAIPPDNKSKGETLSTLRFGARARLMKNEPVINEITEDDVNDLSDQIRLLKEELLRAKSSTCNSSSNHGYFQGANARESLNQLRQSLNRSLILPRLSNDSEEYVCINEDDVKELTLQIDNIRSSHEENMKTDSDNEDSRLLYSAEGCEMDLTCEHYMSCSEESEAHSELPSVNNEQTMDNPKQVAADPPIWSSMSISQSERSGVLEGPVFSESPKIKNSQRKSLILLSSQLSNHDDAVRISKNLCSLPESHQQSDLHRSLRSSGVFPGPTESLAASLHRGLQIIDHRQRNSAAARSSVSFSFEHLSLKPCASVDMGNPSVQTTQEHTPVPSATFVCKKCKVSSSDPEDSLTEMRLTEDGSTDPNGLTIEVTKGVVQREKELSDICKGQADEIEHLKLLLEQSKCEIDHSTSNQLLHISQDELLHISQDEQENCDPLTSENKIVTWNGDETLETEVIKEQCEIKEVQEDCNHTADFSMEEKDALLREIEILKSKLQWYTDAPTRRSTDKLRSSLISQSIQLRKSFAANAQGNNAEEFDKERQRWMEMESDWISLTEDLRIDIESNRQRAEQVEMELKLEKKCTEELDDALKRSVMGQARMIEHYAELQEKHNDIVVRHRAIMESVAEVKRAASKAGSKGRHGSRFAKAFAAELSSSRAERDREREFLKKENQSLKIQLKDTAEAVHAAGELLVRLREAEEAASIAEGKSTNLEEENDKLKKQMEKLKRKHKMEIITMKQYLEQSRLPEAALRPIYGDDSDTLRHENTSTLDDDQAWRAEFGAIYQDHY